jgi:hypothetical protein
MKKKWQGTLLLIAVLLLVFVVIPLALFSTVPGTYAPPAPDSPEAQIPILPYPVAKVAVPEPSPEPGEMPPEEAPAPEESLNTVAEILNDKTVKRLLVAYKNRQPDPPAGAENIYHG